MSALLELRAVSRRFGGVAAVEHASFTMAPGETLGIIGPNGAGKTTLLNLITGVFPVSEGQIFFRGEEITSQPPNRICRRGIGRTYQIPQPFGNMTVRGNVMLGCLYGRRDVLSVKEAASQADGILERLGLSELSARLAKDLTLLERKRLELARALSLEPRLILLDEIAAGLTHRELPVLKGLIRDLQAAGLSMIIIEHVFELVFDLCQRVLVLDWGKKVAEGTPAEVARDPRVLEVYLGSRESPPGDYRMRGMPSETAAPARQAAPASPEAAAPLLRVRGIDVYYGALQALFGVSLEVWPGEIVALLGANGSGKTTTVRAISGTLRPARGDVYFDGLRIDRLPTGRIVELGITQCMEGRRIFPELSVLENLEIGAYAMRARARAKEILAVVYDLFPVLFDRRSQQGQTLSGGEQQMLAVGRAMMASPRLLLLDEVSLGLAPVITEHLYEAIRRINRQGVAVLLVEQNVHRSLSVSHRGYILERGRITLAGTAAELSGSERLTEQYFGLQGGTGMLGQPKRPNCNRTA
jgi:branched-chain amino acid transport system ATP-binding protein